jgi:NADPH2:quinone reductase
MKLVQAEKIGSVEDYRLVEAPRPTPAEGDVLIRVKMCGMGYVDALVALGGYQVKPPVPFTPGQEISGVVEAVGAQVQSVKIGDRVMANSFGGGLAEYVAVPQAMVTVIPDQLADAQAAGFRVNYLTALHGLRDRAQIRAGERLLVFGAAGGVGRPFKWVKCWVRTSLPLPQQKKNGPLLLSLARMPRLMPMKMAGATG